ncbi:MAG: PQQ-like beta-propeller repeat protein [Spirochaetes bacterium]|nr:PQQ-like beta-propeller repeat protein [Spirochaetota bacterium]
MRFFPPFLLAVILASMPGCEKNTDNANWIIGLLLLGDSPRLDTDAPWPMWQHDPSHTGRSPYNGPVSAPSLADYEDLCCHGIFGSPVVDEDSNVYIGSIRSGEITTICAAFENPTVGASGLLHGLDSGGSPLAGFPYDSNRGSVMATAIECAPLLLDDGSIVFGKDDGYMYRLRADGELIWESLADDPFDPLAPTDDNEQMIPSPLPGSGSTVYFLSHFADVYGPGPVKDAVEAACPAIDYFKDTATPWYSKLYSLNMSNGTRRWVFNPEDDTASWGQPMVGWGSPALGSDGSCIIGLMHTELPGDHYVPTKGRVFAIGPGGTRSWVFPAEGEFPIDYDYSIWASPVVSPSGNIYIGASDYTYDEGARLYSLTPGGIERWHYDFPENTIAATPALLSDGTIIVATQNRHLTDENERFGAIYALEDQGDSALLLWRYPETGTDVPSGFYSSPLVDGSDRVYIANEPFPSGTGTGLFLGLDSDGTLLFSIPLAGYVHGNLALGPDGTLYVPLHRPARLLMYR